MFMALVFALNQVLSHGFGLFLFAALVPMMREDIAITHWHLALVGALTQIAYLAGALLLGAIGPKIGTSRLSVITGITTTSLLMSLSIIEDPVLIIILLSIMAASASISWGTIVEIISRHANANQCATFLTTASSGTAWGYAINGGLILFIVPLLGWQASWLIAALFGALVMGLTCYLLLKLKKAEVEAEAEPHNDVKANVKSKSSQEALSFKALLSTVVNHPVALFACVVCLFVGFATMPFANWLNTYLDSLQLPSELGGYTWTTAGISGMFAGFLIGKLADTKGHPNALMLIFSGFFVCCLAFLYDAELFAPVAGFGYGLMYFPMWGVIAGWVSQSFNATATMQINGICMVSFGFGGTVGNLLAGYIFDLTQSLDLVYMIIAADAFLLVMLGLYIIQHQKRSMNTSLQAEPS